MPHQLRLVAGESSAPPRVVTQIVDRMSWEQRLSAILNVISEHVFPQRGLAEVTVAEHSIHDLSPQFDEFTIAVLTDLHHRQPFHDVRWLRHAVDLTNAMKPDVIALLGDYGSSFKQAPTLSRQWYEEARARTTPELARLRAHDRIFAVLGNHDYYAGVDEVRGWLGGLGIQLLIDCATVIERSGGAQLRVAGLDDVREGRGQGLKYIAGEFQPPTIVLAHNPDGFLAVDSRIRADIGIAGHTHGGQIVLPLIGAPLTMSSVCRRHSTHGWVPNDRGPLYVSRGLGEQLPLPVRIGSRPEILVLRLRAGQQPA